MDHQYIYPLNAVVTVHQSRTFNTNCGVLRKDGQCLIVDAGITPSDFERIAQIVGDAQVCAGLATHAHWDHLLWSTLLGAETPRYASEGTLQLAESQKEETLRILADLEAQNFSGEEVWQRDLLGVEQPLVAGANEICGFRFESVPLNGHCQGQTAFFFAKERVLFAADTLSEIEFPSLTEERYGLEEYLKDLDTLAPLLSQVDWVVPGHGTPKAATKAQETLQADRKYLQKLQSFNRSSLIRDFEGSARKLVEELGDARADIPDAYEMHLQNLRLLSARMK